MGLLNGLGKVAMHVVNNLPDVVNNLQKQALKQHANSMKTIEQQLSEQERKLDSAEMSKSQYSVDHQQKLAEAREKLESAKMKVYGTNDVSKQKTIEEWDKEWINIGPLKTADLTPYNCSVGLYRHIIDGKTMYVGRAIELSNGGFRKRLSDYRRESDSARKHRSGQLIYENLNSITTYILVVGQEEEAISITKALESSFISKYSPSWNKMLNI